MSDDLERTLHDSLSRHAAQLGRPAGEIDDIYRRVTHRRQRRRAVAGVGSLAIAAVGVLGIATLGRDGGQAPAAGTPLDGGAWACTGYMGGDGVVSYYADCQVVDQVPVTTSCLTPMTAPATWVDTTLGSPQNAIAEACPVPMPLVDTAPPFACEAPGTVPAPTTGAPMTTMLALTTTPSIPSTTTTVASLACDYQEQRYEVLPGDGVYSIARLFGIDPQILANYNSWPEGIDHPLFVGDIVLIPPGVPTPTVPYVIDTTAVGTLPPATTSPPPTAAESTAP